MRPSTLSLLLAMLSSVAGLASSRRSLLDSSMTRGSTGYSTLARAAEAGRARLPWRGTKQPGQAAAQAAAAAAAATRNASEPSQQAASLRGGCTAWPPQGWGAAAPAAVAGPASGWAPAPRLTALTPGVAAALTRAAEQWAADAVATGRSLPAECWRGVQLLEVGEVDAACEAAGSSASSGSGGRAGGGSSARGSRTVTLRFTPRFACSSIHFTTLRGSRMEVRRTLFAAVDLPASSAGSVGGRALTVVPHRVTYPMTLGS